MTYSKIMGTAFDLDNDDGAWFTFFNSSINDDRETVYDAPDEDAGRFCLRSMTPFVEDFFSDRKMVSEFVLNKSNRSMEKVSSPKEMTSTERKIYQADLWDYVIIDFDGILDKKGNAIECTKENKSKLMAIPAMDRFVAKCLKTIGNNAVLEVSELSENL